MDSQTHCHVPSIIWAQHQHLFTYIDLIYKYNVSFFFNAHSNPDELDMTRIKTLSLCFLLSTFFFMHAAHSQQQSETEHQELMDKMFQTSKKPVKDIGILVYDGVNSLDVMGPRYVLSQLMGTTTKLISIKPGNIKTVKGVEIVPDTTMGEVDSLDILVVPGGFEGTIRASYNDEVKNWIRKIDKTTMYTTAVCTGGWILASTGLLEGKKVTTNWYRAEEKMAKYGAKFINERYVRDGKFWTSAGVTAAIDMSLAIVNELRGEKYTQGVMLDLEYDPAPPVIGGSPENTPDDVLNMMQGMYDAGIIPLVEQLEKERR